MQRNFTMVSRVLWALDNEIEPRSFERLCIDLLSLEGYSKIIPIGGMHDRGRDAELFDSSTGIRTFFQYSLEDRWRSKLQKELKKVHENGHIIDEFIFVTTSVVSGKTRDSLIPSVKKQYSWELIIFDREWLRNRLEVQYPELAAKYLGIIDTTSKFGEQQNIIPTVSSSIAPTTLQSAESLLAQGEYEAAIIEYQHYLKDHKNDPGIDHLFYKVAYCQYHLHRYNDAFISINSAIKLGGDNVTYSIAKAVILAESGIDEGDRPKLNIARKMLSKLADNSQDWLVYYNLANVLSALGEQERAKDAYLTASNLKPTEAVIWNNLGNLYGQIGDTDEEMICYDKALRLEPNLSEALASKGIALLQSFDKPEEAIPLFDQVLNSRNQSAEWKQGWFWLALACYKLKDVSKALEYIDEGLEVLPTHAGLLNLKADIYSMLWRDDDAQVDEAIQFFEYLNDLGTTTFDSLVELAQLYLYRSQLEKASNLLENHYDIPHTTLHIFLKSLLGHKNRLLDLELNLVSTTLKHFAVYKLFRRRYALPTKIQFLSLENGLTISPKTIDYINFACSTSFGRAYDNLLNETEENRLDALLRSQHEVALGLEILVHDSYEMLVSQHSTLSSDEKQSLKKYLLSFAMLEWITQLGWISGKLRLPEEETIRILEEGNGVKRFIDEMFDNL